MRLLSLSAVVLFGVLPAFGASLKYQSISLPGAPVGIDNAGDIAGNSTNNGVSQGYFVVNGVVTTLASNESVLSLSNSGELLLRAPVALPYGQTGFSYATYSNGIYTPLNLPVFYSYGVAASYTPIAINNSGELLADFSNSLVDIPLLINGTQISMGQEVLGGNSSLTGFNNAGAILGYLSAGRTALPSGTPELYEPTAGTWSVLSYLPTIPSSSESTKLLSINDAGEGVGSTTDFVSIPITTAIAYENGSFFNIAPPGSSNSAAFGINAQGDIVGESFDVNGQGTIGNVEYFVASPDAGNSATPEPVSAVLLLSGLGLISALPGRRRARLRPCYEDTFLMRASRKRK